MQYQPRNSTSPAQQQTSQGNTSTEPLETKYLLPVNLGSLLACQLGLPTRPANLACQLGLPTRSANLACQVGLPTRLANSACPLGLPTRLPTRRANLPANTDSTRNGLQISFQIHPATLGIWTVWFWALLLYRWAHIRFTSEVQPCENLERIHTWKFVSEIGAKTSIWAPKRSKKFLCEPCSDWHKVKPSYRVICIWIRDDCLLRERRPDNKTKKAYAIICLSPSFLFAVHIMFLQAFWEANLKQAFLKVKIEVKFRMNFAFLFAQVSC